MGIAKPCPRCGKPLVLRTNGETKEKFLGCSGYPDCTYTQSVPVDQLLRATGAPTLPGL